MRKVEQLARPSARRVRRGALVAVVAAVTLFAAACGGGGGGGAPQPAPAPGGNNAAAAGEAPPDAASVTATAGEFPLPPGTPGAGKPPVAIGTKDFPEEFVLGQLYTQALQAKGFTVNLTPNIGGSEVIDKAFQANQIQMYPEYLGEIATSIAGQPKAPPTAMQTYQVVQQFEQTQRGATLFQQTPFQDTDVLIVKPQFAQQHQLQAIPDLNRVGPGGQGVTVAAQPPFRTRYNGLVGMQQAYGLTNVQFLGLQAGTTYQALDANQANVADAFSTDAQLLSGNYVQLADPQNIFGSQYVAPVVKQAVAQQQGPAFEQTCNWVSSLLTTRAIQAMNQQVQANGADPAVVARQFLDANGLHR